MEDKELINSAYKKAMEDLNLKLKYHEQVDKLVFLSVFNDLHVMYGGDIELIKHWMDQYNKHLMFIPKLMIGHKESLYTIASYLRELSNH